MAYAPYLALGAIVVLLLHEGGRRLGAGLGSGIRITKHAARIFLFDDQMRLSYTGGTWQWRLTLCDVLDLSSYWLSYSRACSPGGCKPAGRYR